MVQPGAIILKTTGTQRAVTFGGVVALHVLLLAILSATGTIPAILPAVLSTRLILQPHRPPPPPPPIQPVLSAPPIPAMPLPEIRLAAPPPLQPPPVQPLSVQPMAPRAITRATPTAHPVGHFGAGTDSGLGLDVAAGAGGGSSARGTLAGFEAAVRARVLAAKHQPTLAWDRRNTCVVTYRISVSRSGRLAGFSIDPCGVPEINQAARDALQSAGPFPPPPELGAATTEVHGSMIFHP